jgi:hypothetical protein
MVVAPAPEPSSWRQVQSAYERFIAAQFPGAAPTMLAALLDQRLDEVMPLMSRFVADQRRSALPADLHGERNASEISKIELLGRMVMVRAAFQNESQRRDTYGQRAIEFGDRKVA